MEQVYLQAIGTADTVGTLQEFRLTPELLCFFC
jgi:hypothetical protein